MFRSFFCFLLVALFFGPAAHAQPTGNWPTPEAEQLYQTARNYLNNGNFSQAISSYQQAIQLAPGKVILYRDMAQALLLSGNTGQAEKVINSILEKGRGDEGTYQIAANIQAAYRKPRGAEKILNEGLKKFPNSGLLYHEMGLLNEGQKWPSEALKNWLKGIEVDPDYRVNYYEAARMYAGTADFAWALIYAEIFVNLERVTPRANEARKILVNAYKRLYLRPDPANVPEFGKSKKEKAPDFITLVQQQLLQQAAVMTDGVTVENLIMARVRFLNQWQKSYARRYPFALFSYWDDLLRQGDFDAYNQWLFAPAINPAEYNSWKTFHAGALPRLETVQQAKPFKPKARQAYNDGEVSKLFQRK